MSDYRRNFVPGGTFFFTLVTERRAPLFANESARTLLGEALRECQAKHPFKVVAMVLLPDHFHALWELPAGDDDFSTRWKNIKSAFTRRWLAQGGREQPRRRSRVREKRRGVWQRRFWEHTIRDLVDLENHFDYIHFNPVKHGYVNRVRDWQPSTFHRWVEHGHYDIQWGAGYIPVLLPGDAGE
ncbi:transposase [Anatilimnocola sp. NA78]|uniref:REP-associated tyrosine transposase n=1 Tax=Anatilimnocola sp. NA78 TaxID=3415683 RepID=UPI003CE4E29C